MSAVMFGTDTQLIQPLMDVCIVVAYGDQCMFVPEPRDLRGAFSLSRIFHLKSFVPWSRL